MRFYSLKLWGILSVALLLVSCTRDSTTTSVSKSALLSRVPPDVAMILSKSNLTSAYKKYKDSNQVLPQLPLNFDSLGEDFKGVAQLGKSLQQVGLLDDHMEFTEIIGEGVFFASFPTTGTHVAAGFFGERAGSTRLIEKLDALESVLKSESIPVKRTTIDSVSALEISVPGASQVVIVAANQERIAISSSRDIAARLFETQSEDYKHPLLSSEQFAKAQAGFNSANQLSLTYVDFRSIVDSAKKSGAFPPEQSAELDKFPAVSFSHSREFDGNLSDLINVTLEPRNDEQKKILATLSSTAKSADLSTLPAGYLGALSLDISTFGALRNVLLQRGDLPNAGEISKELAFLDDLSHFELAAFPVAGASPFPELVFAISGKGAPEVFNRLKVAGTENIGPMAGGAQWKERKVGATSVFSMPSPLGLEPSIALVGSTVLLTVSSSIMDKTIASYEGSAPQGIASYLSVLGGSGGTVDGFALAVLDFPQVASTIESVQGTFAMLTGGQSAVDPEMLRTLKSSGIVGIRARYLENRFAIEAKYRSAPGGS